jgi:hypothetical protein
MQLYLEQILTTIPVFERAKVFYAGVRAATMTGCIIFLSS